jgi:hypothetical protein
LSRHVTVAGTHAAESALGSKQVCHLSKAEHATASSEGSPASACSGVHIRANLAERHQRRARPETPRARRPAPGGSSVRRDAPAGHPVAPDTHHVSPNPFTLGEGGTEGQRDRERTSYSYLTVQAGCGPWITTAGSIVGPWLARLGSGMARRLKVTDSQAGRTVYPPQPSHGGGSASSATKVVRTLLTAKPRNPGWGQGDEGEPTRTRPPVLFWATGVRAGHAWHV